MRPDEKTAAALNEAYYQWGKLSSTTRARLEQIAQAIAAELSLCSECGECPPYGCDCFADCKPEPKVIEEVIRL